MDPMHNSLADIDINRNNQFLESPAWQAVIK